MRRFLACVLVSLGFSPSAQAALDIGYVALRSWSESKDKK